MRGIVRLQEQIAGLLETGTDVAAIERDVIGPAPVGEEQKSALWLFTQLLAGQATVAPRLSQISAAGTNGRAATAGTDARLGHGPPTA